MNIEKMQFGFIGLGLIGGSIARALKQVYPACDITAYDLDQTSLEIAQKEGIVNHISTQINETFQNRDMIFLCAPVSSNDENLLTLKQYLSPSTLLTDVGSVKSGIHKIVEEIGLSAQFIGGHPMAGSERFGYINSKAKLLENAFYILTPTRDVPEKQVALYKELVLSIGAIPLVLSCKEHDYATAGISHLPHVVAASLVNLVQKSDNANGVMKMIAAGGFKDITRIASSSPVMWENICMSNTANIISLLDDYIASLQDIREEINSQNATQIHDFFDSARSYRESFIDASSGPIKKSYVVYIDIPDEPGALATIATLLAFQQISIKNIGITHNREYAEGSLQIELYDEDAIAKACEILSAKGYSVHIKK